MSRTSFHRSNQDNVHVTLEPADPQENPLFGKKYPCSVCGNALEIRFTRKNKPYTICLDCGIQTFFRGKAAIKRLTEIVTSKVLIAGNGSKTELAVLLFNRIQQLRAQKKQLAEKQGLIFPDLDLENALQAFENEIKRVQGELAELAERKTRRGKQQ
jgi:DNA-directed RNA polymerase subunit RPC12/RpoP